MVISLYNIVHYDYIFSLQLFLHWLFFSESLMHKLQPVCGVVNSVTQLIPLSYPAKESTEPDSTTEKKFQTLEDKYLPDMKKVPGTEIRFTEIPKNKLVTH